MTNQPNGMLSLDDGQLYYEVMGEGMPLVLSHAAFLDSRMFDGIVVALAQKYRVVRYDMLGFGQSSEVHGPLCRRNHLDQLLKHLNITRAHLVSCSNGGQLALDLVLERPELAASLTLVGSTPSGFDMQGEPPRYLMEMIAAVQVGEVDRASELAIRIWLDGQFRESDQMDQALRQKALEMNCIPTSRKTFLIADMQPVSPLDPPAITRLSEVHCPTLVVVGNLDHPEVMRAADVMEQGISGARKVIFEGTGHVPSYEQPEKFTKTLLDFLKEDLG